MVRNLAVIIEPFLSIAHSFGFGIFDLELHAPSARVRGD